MSSSTLERRSRNTRNGPSSQLEALDTLLPSKEDWFRLTTVAGGAMLVAYICNLMFNYLTNDLEKPLYCDTVSLDLQRKSTDQCQPSPENGECYDGKFDCLREYKNDDRYTDVQAKKVSKLILDQLCGSYAQFLCYGYGRIWVAEETLWNNVVKYQLSNNILADDVTFSNTKNGALKYVAASLDMRTTSDGIKEFKCADNFATRYMPFSCKIRGWILQHVVYVFSSSLMVVALLLLSWKIKRKRQFSSRAEQLYQQICNVLEENALASKSGSGSHEAWIVSSWLRDHLLLPKERKQNRLWEKVVELVQEDSRIDMFPALVKGESKVVWEWQVEGILNSERLGRKYESGKSIYSNY